MRRLLLLRHARAVPHTSEDDFDRVLTESGREDARRIGALLDAARWVPDLCLYSGAARTRETYELVAGAFPGGFPAAENNALYDATRFLILGLLRELQPSVETALIVGHNPGMGDVANLLSGAGDAAERLRLQSKFPTAALAVIGFDRPGWSELGAGAGRLERFVCPSDF